MNEFFYRCEIFFLFIHSLLIHLNLVTIPATKTNKPLVVYLLVCYYYYYYYKN